MKRIKPLTRTRMLSARVYQGILLDILEKQLQSALATLNEKKAAQEN